ncbi:MAG: 50S ribosomal protein L22 [Chloroflexi bacterium]|nr:50S ribosomal protein L22 [Chloroflexota bacterium]
MESHLVRASAIRVPGSPQKARLVANMVRGKGANAALVLLKFMPNAAAKDVAKVIKSAMANAEENFGMNADDLVVKTIMVDGAQFLKRRRFASRGRSNMIQKRMSHISVVLTEREGTA